MRRLPKDPAFLVSVEAMRLEFTDALLRLDETNAVPDHVSETLVNWADDLDVNDPTYAFDPDLFDELLPALGVAWMASHH